MRGGSPCKVPGCHRFRKVDGLCWRHTNGRDIHQCTRCGLSSVDKLCSHCVAEQEQVDRVTQKHGLPAPDVREWRQDLSFNFTDGW